MVLSFRDSDSFNSDRHIEPIEVFLVRTSALWLINKDCGMCYPVCEIVHIKESLLLIEKGSQWGGSSCFYPHDIFKSSAI